MRILLLAIVFVFIASCNIFNTDNKSSPSREDHKIISIKIPIDSNFQYTSLSIFKIAIFSPNQDTLTIYNSDYTDYVKVDSVYLPTNFNGQLSVNLFDSSMNLIYKKTKLIDIFSIRSGTIIFDTQKVTCDDILGENPIKVLYPKGGENFKIGDSVIIKFASKASNSYCRLSIDGGRLFDQITLPIKNNESECKILTQLWIIGNDIDGIEYQSKNDSSMIKVESYTDGTIYSLSNYFSISK